MILFEEDWSRYPSAIIDTQTVNRSFVRMASVYKNMGVKNHAWPLALIHKELQGVDPRDPYLSDELKLIIGVECRINPWYFFREVTRLPPIAGPHPMPFLANRGNLGLIWAFLGGVDVANIQPRQTGKSASTDTLMTWMHDIGSSNTLFTLLTKDDKLRKENIGRLKRIREYIPSYMAMRDKTDADNQVELTCNALMNRYTTAVAQNSEIGANNLGRGLTCAVLQIDEGPFINFINIAIPAAAAAGGAAREQAREYGRPNGVIFTTTAGKKDGREGAFMYKLIHGGAEWNERYFDARNRDQLRSMVEMHATGKRILVNITMSHRQLGKTDEWLYEKIIESSGSHEQVNRDFMNIWTSGANDSPLSPALMEKILNSEKEPDHVEISPELYMLKWYIPEDQIADRMRTGRFVVGLDTSDAINRDAIGLLVQDAYTLETVAAAKYNETNLYRFSNYLGNLMIKYTNWTLVPEKKSSAQMIIDHLTIMLINAGFDPFRRIFNRIVDENDTDSDEFQHILTSVDARSDAFYDKRKIKFGFNTTGASRNLLYSTILQNSAKKSGQVVHDKALSSELRGLVVRNNRIDHSESEDGEAGHDDMVIAWLMSNWFLSHGRNLSHYGINPRAVGASLTSTGETMDPIQQLQDARQRELVDKIHGLLELLKSDLGEIQQLRIENQLHGLSQRYEVLRNQYPSEVVLGNLDAMITHAKEESGRKRQLSVGAARAKIHRNNTVGQYNYHSLYSNGGGGQFIPFS